MTPRPLAGAKSGKVRSRFPENLRALQGAHSQGEFAEALGVAEVQRALREALRAKRPVWLVVG